MSTNTETIDVLDTIDEVKFPEIPRQVDTTVELLRGLLNHETGAWERTAEVRELNGYDEEKIALLEGRKGITYIEYFTEVLKLGVVSIGDADFKGRLNELTIGDRNILFLAIVRATYGRQRTFDRACMECNEINTVTIDLYDDFTNQTPTFDPTGTIKVKMKNGVTHEMRPPTADDTIFAGKKDSKGPSQTSALIARCSIWHGAAPSDPEDWARSLSMADRNTLVKALLDLKMGPKMDEVDATCVHCGADMPVLIDWIFLILG